MLDPRKRRHQHLPVVFPDVGAGNDEAEFTDAGVGEPPRQLPGQARGDENRVGASGAFNVDPYGLHGLLFEGNCAGAWSCRPAARSTAPADRWNGGPAGRARPNGRITAIFRSEDPH